MVIDDRKFQLSVSVGLGSLEQILDVDVSVRERIPTENDMVHLAQGNVRPVPDRAEEDII